MHRRGTSRGLLSLLAAFAICMASAQLAMAGLYDPIWVNSASAERAGVLKVLDEPTEIKCNRTPLAGVIQDFKNTHHLEIQLDAKAFEEAGVAIDSPVTFEIQGATVRQALDLILRPLELTWVIRDGGLLVTTLSHAETYNETVIYPVEDLLLLPAELQVPGRRYGPDYDSLIELMTSMISPTTWGEGNSGLHAPFHGAIVCAQTAEVLEAIADMLDELRIARIAQFPSAKDHPAVEKSGRQRASDAAFAALQRPIKLDLTDADVDALARQIASHSKVPAAVDYKALEEAGIEGSKLRLTRRLPNLPLHTALDRLLEGTKMTWAISDGVLLITTESTSETLVETRVYNIHDLGEPTRSSLQQSAIDPPVDDIRAADARPGSSLLQSPYLAQVLPPYFGYPVAENFDNVLELVNASIEPTSWSEVGGAGSVRPLASAGALVVSQTARIHLEVEQFLAGLRKFRAEHPHDPADKKASLDDLVLLAYRIPAGSGSETVEVRRKKDKDQPTEIETRVIEPALAVRERIAREWAAALPKLIAPETWGAERGSIRLVSDVLYIRQRPAVHEQIARLLQPRWWRGGMGGGMGQFVVPR